MSMNGLQSKHCWWHRHCTKCNCSNYPRGTGMKKTVLGITKALLAQNMGKSWGQMCFCRSSAQWLRKSCFPGLLWSLKRKDADSVVGYVLTGCPGAPFPCAVFQFIVHQESKKWSLSLHGSPALHTLSRRYRQSTGNPCWGMHLVQGAGTFPQHTGVALTDWGINLDAHDVSPGSQEVFKTLNWSFNTAASFLLNTWCLFTCQCVEDPIRFFPVCFLMGCVNLQQSETVIPGMTEKCWEAGKLQWRNDSSCTMKGLAAALVKCIICIPTWGERITSDALSVKTEHLMNFIGAADVYKQSSEFCAKISTLKPGAEFDLLQHTWQLFF